jgi:hypothetical protein
MTKLEFATLMQAAARAKVTQALNSEISELLTPTHRAVIAAILYEPLNAELTYWTNVVKELTSVKS